MCCAVLYCFFLCFLQISALKILFGLISTTTSISAPLRLLLLTRLCRRADEQNCAWNTNWFFLSSSLRPSFLSSSFSLVWIWLLLRSLFLLHSWQDHLFLHPHLTRSSSFLANLPFFFFFSDAGAASLRDCMLIGDFCCHLEHCFRSSPYPSFSSSSLLLAIANFAEEQKVIRRRRRSIDCKVCKLAVNLRRRPPSAKW